MKASEVLIIIPAFNEAQNILATVNQLRNLDISYDYIVVNDGSSDSTYQICVDNNIPVLDLKMNLGIGGAVQTGYKYAIRNAYKYAVQFDGDGQHIADYIDEILNYLENENADICIGSRFLSKQDTYEIEWNRKLGIKIIHSLLKWLIHKNVTDPTSGFRACNLKSMHLFAQHYPSEYPEPSSLVLLNKYHLKIVEFPVRMNKRSNGVSSITYLNTFYYMINVCTLMILIRLSKFNVEGNDNHA